MVHRLPPSTRRTASTWDDGVTDAQPRGTRKRRRLGSASATLRARSANGLSASLVVPRSSVSSRGAWPGRRPIFDNLLRRRRATRKALDVVSRDVRRRPRRARNRASEYRRSRCSPASIAIRLFSCGERPRTLSVLRGRSAVVGCHVHRGPVRTFSVGTRWSDRAPMAGAPRARTFPPGCGSCRRNGQRRLEPGCFPATGGRRSDRPACRGGPSWSSPDVFRRGAGGGPTVRRAGVSPLGRPGCLPPRRGGRSGRAGWRGQPRVGLGRSPSVLGRLREGAMFTRCARSSSGARSWQRG